MNFVWIPEAPKHPGLYANEADTVGADSRGPQPSTMNPHKARHFPTQGECQSWCEANPSPAFAPQQHGFED